MLQGQPAAGVPAVPANRLPGDAPPVGGQPASVQPASAGHRWLFIVETSSPMRRRQTATLKAVDELLGSQMRGQLRTGDSLALWTFNETLSPARLPVQKWSVTNHMAIVGRVHAFLQARTYEKTPSLSDAVPAILRLVESSDVLTVLLISSGETKLQGTPFDDKINRVFDTWRDTQRRANTPFLTVLRSRKGQLTDCAATPAQWEAELPPLPALELESGPRTKDAARAPAPAGGCPAADSHRKETQAGRGEHFAGPRHGAGGQAGSGRRCTSAPGRASERGDLQRAPQGGPASHHLRGARRARPSCRTHPSGNRGQSAFPGTVGIAIASSTRRHWRRV